MPTYSVLSLASASALRRRRHPGRRLDPLDERRGDFVDDRLHPRLLLGREIPLGVHPSDGVAHRRLRRLERALGRELAADRYRGACSASACSAKARGSTSAYSSRMETQIVLPRLERLRCDQRRHTRSPAAATRRTSPARPAPPRRRTRTSPCPAPDAAKSARVHTLSALWSLADASLVAWLCAIAVSSVITARGPLFGPVEAGERQEPADVLSVPSRGAPACRARR